MTHLYHKFRPMMKDGDVLEFGSDTNVISRIIQHRTESDVSHTASVIWLRGRVFMIEAAGLDVRLTYLSRYMERCRMHRRRVYWIPLKPEYDHLRDSIVDVQMDAVGIPYDYENLFKSWFCRVSNDASAFFCSELIGDSYEKAGVIPKQDKALWPGEIGKLGATLPRVRIL